MSGGVHALRYRTPTVRVQCPYLYIQYFHGFWVSQELEGELVSGNQTAKLQASREILEPAFFYPKGSVAFNRDAESGEATENIINDALLMLYVELPHRFCQ